jgi:ABC-type glutathione transport system ATPase component
MLLETDVSVSYASGSALDRVQIAVPERSIVGIVGESGAGKSTLAATLLRLEHLRAAKATGKIAFAGLDLMTASASELRRLRGKDLGLVNQSAVASLNPALSLETHLREAWRAHASVPYSGARNWIEELLTSVGLEHDKNFLHRLPRQISGGQAQRFLICLSVLHRPKLLIADEPTSSVDAVNRADILKLLNRLNEHLGTSVLLISHDLLSIARLCAVVYVLHRGRIVESGTTLEVLTCPRHPFTRQLVEAWGGIALLAASQPPYAPAAI